MTTSGLLLFFFIFALCLCCMVMTNPPASTSANTYVDQYGGLYYTSNWWNPFSWWSQPTYSIDYDGAYPSYDSTYVDGNSRGWYNAGGWYGQTAARPYYGYGWGNRAYSRGYGLRWS